jgi:type I restriction enzyme S subunit
MAGEWKTLRISDLGRIVTGKTPSTKVKENFGQDIPFVTPSDMDGRKTISETARSLSISGAETVKNTVLPAGAVIVSCIGSDMGKAAIAGRECVTNQQINSIIASDEWCAEYVYYDLSTRKAELQNLASSGSAQPILNKGHFSQISIVMPPINEQQAIASVLGALDDKIELNHRMNETLEEMARALFKSWFVDFDPVRARMEGRQLYGMDDEIIDLFPDSFEDSSLGKIPKGWSVGTVADDFDITMGQSPPGETYNEVGEGLPFYQGRRDFKFRYPDLRVYCSAPKRTAESGDTLVSVRAPVGDVNMAESVCCVGRGVAAVRHKTGSRSYTYYAMRSLKSYFERFESEGTVFGAVNKQEFMMIPFLLPPSALVDRFEVVVSPLDQRIEVQEKQSRTLAAIRDALLPKLLSGEIRVREAEEILEELH